MCYEWSSIATPACREWRDHRQAIGQQHRQVASWGTSGPVNYGSERVSGVSTVTTGDVEYRAPGCASGPISPSMLDHSANVSPKILPPCELVIFDDRISLSINKYSTWTRPCKEIDCLKNALYRWATADFFMLTTPIGPVLRPGVSLFGGSSRRRQPLATPCSGANAHVTLAVPKRV
jgi:hypothetical protein